MSEIVWVWMVFSGALMAVVGFIGHVGDPSRGRKEGSTAGMWAALGVAGMFWWGLGLLIGHWGG